MTGDQQPVRVGIIGGGLMGKEAAVAFARWAVLVDHPVRPELTHVCDIEPAALDWFDYFPSVQVRSTDYRALLGPDGPEVVYIAVRHDLHERMYVDAIEAGVSLLAEKPFGIDLAAAKRIYQAAERHPKSFVRCSSELPFFPAAQAAISRVTSGSLGRIIEVHSGFSHSSDLDVHKPINWKRQARYCGANGVLNDLGMHVLHVPLRLGWVPDRVFAVMQDLVPSRPGPDGDLVLRHHRERHPAVHRNRPDRRSGGRGLPPAPHHEADRPGAKELLVTEGAGDERWGGILHAVPQDAARDVRRGW